MIIDVCLFNDELDILELRLRELDDLVDLFIVLEGDETFAGTGKDPACDPHAPRWRPWRGRLRRVSVPRLPHADSRWEREAYARNGMVRATEDLPADAHVLCSDVDEIPDKATIRSTIDRVGGDTWLGFCPPYSYYYLNLRTSEQVGAMSLSTVATLRRHGGQGLRDRRNDPPLLSQTGWHFSYMGGIAAIQAKLRCFSHAEYDTAFYRDPVRLAGLVDARKDLFDRGRTFAQVPLSAMPGEVRANPDRYRHLLLEER